MNAGEYLNVNVFKNESAKIVSLAVYIPNLERKAKTQSVRRIVATRRPQTTPTML